MLTTLLFPISLILLLIAGIGFVVSTLYRRAEKDRAYVRTGLGGQKIVLDGGSVILPIFQAIAWVNLQTLRLDVARSAADALISKDRMRVDIGVEFYVRVKPDAQSIALAAQTLGERTMHADQLRELVEAKFVDALRSVAATMTLADLQEKRADFVRAVQTTVANDLELNGLELEAASLTKLDQTDTQYFNPNNAFDAEGLATLTRIIEARKRERNEVVRATEVAIAQQDLEARKQTLAVELTKREAELNQERDIVNKTAETRAAAAQREAEARRFEEEARIASEQAISERKAEAQRVQEQANIASTLAISQRKIEADREAETLMIAQKRDVELANQDRQIAIAERSRAESEARALAQEARAKATSAEESVVTAREVAIAERERQIAVIAAKRDAEQQATAVTVAAEAEKFAAEDKAEAVRIVAKADADATLIRADAQARTYEVDAEGQRKLNEARNTLAKEIIEFEITKERLKIIPAALAESVRPLEKIGDVKIIDMGGTAFGGGQSGTAGGGGGGGTGSIPDNLLGALLAYRAQAPMIDKLLTEAGFAPAANPVDQILGAANAPAPSSPSPSKPGA
ncbi:flotillin family protein [Oryzibacter oryziterrae]|uniref:flotillin family protein n=1 Tax=Oryzibacter oryziterrae TaxID=2766474 RepID=UPI001EFF3EDF|nr:flotillin domain-containing protein [Oryzibacter oryziterrae]